MRSSPSSCKEEFYVRTGDGICNDQFSWNVIRDIKLVINGENVKPPVNAMKFFDNDGYFSHHRATFAGK